MVANIRCGEILNDQLRALQEDQAWTSLVENAQQHLVPNFGSQASDLLESCLTGMTLTQATLLASFQYQQTALPTFRHHFTLHYVVRATTLRMFAYP